MGLVMKNGVNDVRDVDDNAKPQEKPSQLSVAK